MPSMRWLLDLMGNHLSNCTNLHQGIGVTNVLYYPFDSVCYGTMLLGLDCKASGGLMFCCKLKAKKNLSSG